MTTSTPPRAAEALVRLLLAPQHRESVSGDLLEEYRECILPARGRLRADVWYIRQVAGFLSYDSRLWAALLGAALIGRTALDWLVPAMDFQSRATVSTVLAVGILLCAGFAAAWRTGSSLTGAVAGIMTVVVASVISILGAVWLLVIYHDQRTLAAIQASGGLAEIFTLPIILIVPGACLGTVGGAIGCVARSRAAGHRDGGPIR